MSVHDEFPAEFQDCVRFHGHVCPGLAIGYAASKAAESVLGLSRSEDEEVVAVVENDSCAVDAVQVLMGCTFGKGNLIFRDWGKQVFTFLDRKSGRAVRLSFGRKSLPGHEERRDLKEKMDSGEASHSDKELWEELRAKVVMALIKAEPEDFFWVKEIQMEMPPSAQVVSTKPCAKCGEATMVTRLVQTDQGVVCKECAALNNLNEKH